MYVGVILIAKCTVISIYNRADYKTQVAPQVKIGQFSPKRSKMFTCCIKLIEFKVYDVTR